MIDRDGTAASLWQGTTEKYLIKNKPKPNFHYDVIIAGGGITGISTALLLQEAGKKCIVFEANTLCFGTTSGTTAHLNTVMDTPYSAIIKNFGKENALLVAKMAREVIDHIKNNIEKYSIVCGFEETPGYMFSQDKKQQQELEDIAKICHELKVDIRFLKRVPMSVTCTKALKMAKQGKFHPTQYVHGLARAFENLGGVIVENCRVQNVDHSQNITLSTAAGVFHANHLIFATHIPPGVNLLDLRCAPYRSYAMAFSVEKNKYPKGLFYDMYDPYHYYRSQKIGRKEFLIAGGEDHKTAHVENTIACFVKLESHIRSLFKVKEIHYRWSSQYFEPVDGLPYIGHTPGGPENIFVATGFGGNGMIYSGASAIILKKILFNEDSPYIKLFDPNRIKPMAGFTNFVKENADTVKNWIGKFLPADKLNDFAALATGESKVIRFEDHTIALSKDEKGNLHAIDPICTHMGCSVSWNAAEKTWDCPCHGSRFSIEGKVLTGPADKDLKKIDLKQLVR
jgi:hypothetical protein